MEKLKLYKPIFCFCLIGFFLCLQFLFSIKFEEPYPCVRLPGFGSIPQDNNEIVTTSFSLAVQMSDGQVVEFPCRKNFPTIPQWYVPYFSKSLMNKQLSDLSNEDQVDFKKWLKNQIFRKIGNDDFQSVIVNEKIQTFNKSDQSVRMEVVRSKQFKLPKE